MTQYPHGVIDANYQGMETTTEGDQYIWWAHEKSKFVEGGGIVKGIIIVTGYSNSQNLSWLNNLLAVIDMQTDLRNQKFEGIGYEWH